MTESVFSGVGADPQPEPATFDVDSWAAGGKRPTESAIVFKGAHLVGDLNSLKRRYEEARKITEADPDRSLSDEDGADLIAREYADLLREFKASKLEIWCEAVPKDEAAAITRKYPNDPAFAGRCIIAKSITHVRAADGEKVYVKLSAPQVQAIADAVGEPQFGEIIKAYEAASRRLPNVDADFLHDASGRGATKA